MVSVMILQPNNVSMAVYSVLKIVLMYVTTPSYGLALMEYFVVLVNNYVTLNIIVMTSGNIAHKDMIVIIRGNIGYPHINVTILLIRHVLIIHFVTIHHVRATNNV